MIPLNQNSKQNSRPFIKEDGEYPPTIIGRKRTQKSQKNGNVIKLDKCNDKKFISPIVITVKRDKAIKLAMESKVINTPIQKNKYQMQNWDCLIDNIAQSISESAHKSEVFFSNIDVRYECSQLPLDEATAKHCNFNIIGGQATGTYRFITSFYGLTDMPAEFQKARDITLKGLKNTYVFLDDIIIVTGREEELKIIKKESSNASKTSTKNT